MSLEQIHSYIFNYIKNIITIGFEIKKDNILGLYIPYDPNINGPQIIIFRKDLEKPYRSYEFEIHTMIHEIGHHHLIKRVDRCENGWGTKSKSGFVYGPDNRFQVIAHFKEEILAWIYGLFFLWSFKNISFYHKVIISLSTILSSAPDHIMFLFGLFIKDKIQCYKSPPTSLQ